MEKRYNELWLNHIIQNKEETKLTYNGIPVFGMIRDIGDELVKSKKWIRESHNCDCDYCGWHDHMRTCLISTPFPDSCNFVLFYDLEKDIIIGPLSLSGYNRNPNKEYDKDDEFTKRALKDGKMIKKLHELPNMLQIYAK